MSVLAALHGRIGPALGSLKLRITLGAMVAVALGIGLTTVILVQQTERDTLTAVRDRELAEAVHTAASLSRRVVELQRALQMTGELLDPAALGDAEALDRFLLAQPVLITLFNVLSIVHPDGRLLLRIEDGVISRPLLTFGDRPDLVRAVRERRPLISDAMRSLLTGDPVIHFIQPLQKSGQVYALLTGSLNLSRRDLLANLVDDDRSAGAALSVVSDAHGQILAHPDPRLVLAPLSAEPRLADAARRWQASGSAVEPAGLTLLHADDVVSVGGVAGPDWVVWRSVDPRSVFAPLHAARRIALGWAVVLIAGSSGLMLFSVWWMLRPLRRLQTRALHLFDPHFDPAFGWPEGGEIGRLAQVLRQVGVERARLETSNSQLLKKLTSLMGNAPVGIAFTREQRFELVSAELCRMLGRSEAHLLGQPTRTIYTSDDDYAALSTDAVAAFGKGEAYVGDVAMQRPDGSRFWAHLRGRPIDPASRDAGTIWTATDVTDEVANRAQLEWSASHDALTGLANRKVLEQRLARSFEGRPGSLPAAMVMIDLDDFKPVNDRAGHAAGDAMLQAVAGALRARVRSRDLAVRLGGDEFALLLEHCPQESALTIAEDVRSAIGAIVLEWGDHRLQVGASLGVAPLAAETPSVAAWMRAADEACYAAKAAGRGRVHLAPPPQRPALRVVVG